MNVLMILGSRDPGGRTAQAAAALARGLQDAGARTETVFLTGSRIERCRQCNPNGWGACRNEGRCVVEDDFHRLVESIRVCDLVVFATPVYFGDLSETMKAFLDRLRRVTRHDETRRAIEGKPAVGICVAGGGGGGAPTCAVALEKVLITCGFDLLDVIPARRQNLDLKIRLLEATGRWLVERAQGPAQGSRPCP